MTNRQRGKNTERAIAKILKGKRVGVLGNEDIQHPLFSIEVKTRQKFIGDSFMKQAIKNCPQGKTPLAVVHIGGKHHNNDIVLMRLKDFEDYLGKLMIQGGTKDE
ncbi:MAG: hypothetical protein N2738_06250 [Thermodesulfovibrionales bacterium]|nr:hypothetical protein [Thermodesulfovibrionales bacterium]